jgi:hypothetical protein
MYRQRDRCHRSGHGTAIDLPSSPDRPYVPRPSRCYVGVAARQPYKAETMLNHVAAAGGDEIIKGRGARCGRAQGNSEVRAIMCDYVFCLRFIFRGAIM